jgi:hypothetical protein
VRYATNQTYDTRMWQLIEHKASGVEQLRKGDNNLREIEDISGEAANASEMKAAASGNPLILEEVHASHRDQAAGGRGVRLEAHAQHPAGPAARIADDARFREAQGAPGAAQAERASRRSRSLHRAGWQGRSPRRRTPAGRSSARSPRRSRRGQPHFHGLGVYRGLHLYAKRGFGGVSIEAASRAATTTLDVTSYDKDEQFSATGLLRARRQLDRRHRSP